MNGYGAPRFSTTIPKVNGTANAGTLYEMSRADHVHPAQTSVSGNAGTATKLETSRLISLSGDVSGILILMVLKILLLIQIYLALMHLKLLQEQLI